MRPSRRSCELRSRADAVNAWGGGSIILEITPTYSFTNAARYALCFLCICSCISKEHFVV